MEINRLTELKKNAPRDIELKERDGGKKDKEEKKPSSGTNPLTAHMKQFDEIKHGLELIRKNTDTVNALKEKERTIVQEKGRKGVGCVVMDVSSRGLFPALMTLLAPS